MPYLILVRHGESAWNRENRFTGWTDVDLTLHGRVEARQAARLIHAHGLRPELCFTSMLKRAIRTLWIILDELDRPWLPITCNWRLNERHYGALQGLNKAEITHKFGETQVRRWRRAYTERPPALQEDDPRHPCHDPRYASVPLAQLPATLPYWLGTILPELRRGRCVLITGHGNTFRAFTKFLDEVPEEEIFRIEIPTGTPLVYELQDMVARKRYLPDSACSTALHWRRGSIDPRSLSIGWSQANDSRPQRKV